ncbi:1-deoxy-D-xylulose-5-phosphate reductoisomerase [Aquibacillus koreensis]|uniref:1-deoxy-D-xylulose 5-phosphate reductoisomerase n=1 Tax=Aquibacillus koreensis TaxID=279446 RepID=A0A9X3WR63_9BACI|nr:1-deoxy-D-xylulose-5-phosphate reductoisomerase [Aquibacillus koreensis]MCT2534557.1 1-deoxy-D-xylulose-5-phosphate reductoisomerase [Aquibacillus koreensis]MDC3421849.1 1-deoxy-D-xylulose-5-phosphate reductoisomerase [Aquibacillus koreensis]
MKNITLLGATGSIGIQTLDVIRQHKDLFNLYALSFGRNVDKAVPIINEFNPKKIVVQDQETKKKLELYVRNQDILVGSEGMIEISIDTYTDVLVNAVMGSVGLQATLQAIQNKKQIAIANKETLVTAGHLVMEAARIHNVTLLPVDSEHSAIFQCLNGENQKEVNKIIITASGGSFRDKSREELQDVTVEDALNHPNWSMGSKITIDSATMMNKGLEVIEAHWLFDVPYDQIDVVLHKESVIHSMVEFNDNSVIAQLGTPDMRVPIQYALTYPARLPLSNSKKLDLVEIGKLHFSQMDYVRFPCLKMAYDAGREGGTLPTVLNAANEVAVDLFLQGKMSFVSIEKLIGQALEQHVTIPNPDLETILGVDRQTRLEVESYFNKDLVNKI